MSDQGEAEKLISDVCGSLSERFLKYVDEFPEATDEELFNTSKAKAEKIIFEKFGTDIPDLVAVGERILKIFSKSMNEHLNSREPYYGFHILKRPIIDYLVDMVECPPNLNPALLIRTEDEAGFIQFFTKNNNGKSSIFFDVPINKKALGKESCQKLDVFFTSKSIKKRADRMSDLWGRMMGHHIAYQASFNDDVYEAGKFGAEYFWEVFGVRSTDALRFEAIRDDR